MIRCHQRDRDLGALGCRPQPIHRAVGQPVLLVRLQKEKAQPDHARPALPALDQRPALRLSCGKCPKIANPLGIGGLPRPRPLYRWGPIWVDEAGRRRPRSRPSPSGSPRSIARDLPVLPGRRILRPDVDLSIDDQHSGPPRRFRAAPAILRDVTGLPIVSLEATPPPGRLHPRRPVRIAETSGNRVDPHQWHLIASSCISSGKMGSATSGVYSHKQFRLNVAAAIIRHRVRPLARATSRALAAHRRRSISCRFSIRHPARV
jgi:hypothetical protein